MRYIIGDIEQARSKAKFLKKCLKRFDIERSLTQCQGYLASVFGFSSWAEMKSVCSRDHVVPTIPTSIQQFQRMVSSNFDIEQVGNIHAYSIFARMGFCRSVYHFDYRFQGFYREFVSTKDAAVALELIFERYLEIENRCDEADGLIAMAQAIVAPYNDIHPGAFEMNAMKFIDQMKALRIPSDDVECVHSLWRRGHNINHNSPQVGVFVFEGETRDVQHLHAITFMKQSQKAMRFTLPLRWLVDRGGKQKERVDFYLPALTEGGRALIEEFSVAHRIFVVENAPSDAFLVSPRQPKDAVPLSQWNCTLVSATTQEQVDATISNLIQREVSSGRIVSAYADEQLSEHLDALELPKERFFNAQKDRFSWFNDNHKIHDNPELKFWARLKEDPDVIVLQKIAHRGRFPNSEISENRKDILGMVFVTGHTVITGVVAETPTHAIEEFISTTDKLWHFKDDHLDRLRLFHNAEDRSAMFQERMSNTEPSL
jgi:hypothetical protein